MVKKETATKTTAKTSKKEAKTCPLKGKMCKIVEYIKTNHKSKNFRLAVSAVILVLILLAIFPCGSNVSYEYLDSGRGYVKHTHNGNNVKRELCHYVKRNEDTIYYTCKKISEM